MHAKGSHVGFFRSPAPPELVEAIFQNVPRVLVVATKSEQMPGSLHITTAGKLTNVEFSRASAFLDGWNAARRMQFA